MADFPVHQVPEMRRIKRIHFIGIGGAGMSGIAEVFAQPGLQYFRFRPKISEGDQAVVRYGHAGFYRPCRQQP